MGKRRVSVESDVDEVVEKSPASKRARVEDASDDDSAPTPSRAKSSNKGKAKRRNQEDEDEEMPDVAQEQEALEKSQGDRIRAIIRNKAKMAGGIAEHGIIESLEMHQFMCHKYLTFTFGPQINFIIGHNGSGKSAVLTALTIALGGKAGSTGRGSGLKSFIQEGQAASEVSVVIKNRGDEAYKPDLYGRSIIVTRRFTKDGSSTWKIKNWQGRVVSTKRDDLSQICDHMNIQVDNPMNVLTQDAARQFLSAASASDKYKMFLRGTQLSQLSEEYETCMENVITTSKVIEKKKEALPDLRAALQKATDAFEEASKAREQRHKVDEIKKELAWAHVASKEDEMQAAFEEHEKAARRLPRVQNHIDDEATKVREIEKKIEELEGSFNAFNKPDEIESRRREINDEIRAKKGKLKTAIADINGLNNEVKRVNAEIEDFNRLIQEEEAKVAKHSDGRREEAQRKLAAAAAKYVAAEEAMKNIASEQTAKKEELRKLGEEGQVATAVTAEKKQTAKDNYEATQRLEGAQRNKMDAFGVGMGRALDQISHARWHGEVPLGPFGQFVKLRDQKWAKVMTNVLGGLMLGFRITDGRDRQQLKQILETNRVRFNIVVSATDLFDFSHGEPSPDKLTILRALSISNEHVVRVFINAASIEKRLLYESRYEAQEELRNVRGGGVAFTLDLFNVRNYGDGGEQSAPMQTNRSREAEGLFSNKDYAAQYQEAQKRQVQLDEDVKTAVQYERDLRNRYNTTKNEIAQLDRQGRAAQQEVNLTRAARNRLQDEANIEAPIDVQPILDTKRQVEEEKEGYLNQYQAAEETKRGIEEQLNPLNTELDDIRNRLDEFEAGRRDIRKLIEEAALERAAAQKHVIDYQTKLAHEEALVEVAKEKADRTEAEFKSWTAKATEYCDCIKGPREVDVLTKLQKSAEKALAEHSNKRGATIEDTTIEVNKAKAAYDNAKKEIHSMANLNKMLRRSLQNRTIRWQEFRLHIALRTKIIFQHNLANRGFFGKVDFDHSGEQLHLKVQTDGDAQTQAAASREKDPRSLSGGEKSFSTVCLLLALWEAINCPIRCLDEFDVYMDAINRRVTMKMMIDTANASHQKQYILITPQDMNNIHIGQTVRVHRMSDPERGQGTLSFASNAS